MRDLGFSCSYCSGEDLRWRWLEANFLHALQISFLRSSSCQPVCAFVIVCVCTCVRVILHPCLEGKNRVWEQRNNILLLKRHFEWHKPSVVLLCMPLVVYLPQPQMLSGGPDIKEEKCPSTEPAACQHDWQLQPHKWTHVYSFEDVNNLVFSRGSFLRFLRKKRGFSSKGLQILNLFMELLTLMINISKQGM